MKKIQDTTGFGLIKKRFRAQKIKGVLLHRNMEEFVNARSVLIFGKYYTGEHGEIRRKW